MEEESGPASWITAALPIDVVLAAYVERPTVVWLDRRKLTRHKCDSLSITAKPIASHSLNDTTEVGPAQTFRNVRFCAVAAGKADVSGPDLHDPIVRPAWWC